MENIKRVSFEIYNGNIWTQVTLICIALEYGRHAASLVSVKLPDGRIEHYNPVRNLRVS